MKKKLLSVLLVLVLICSLSAAAFADASASRVYDNEGLLTKEQVEDLDSWLDYISYNYDIGVAVTSVGSFDGKTAEEYTEEFYNNNGIGIGDDSRGIILLMSAGENYWCITRFGAAKDIFTAERVDEMANNFSSYMNDGDWYNAAYSFVMDCDTYITLEGGEKTAVNHVYDFEELFEDLDAANLNSRIDKIVAKYSVDVAILTVDSLDGKTAEEYADDYFDYNDFGIGKNRDGILLLLSKSERVWHITTHGYAIFAFPDAYLDAMADEIVPYLSDGDWYGAASSFVSDCDTYLERAYDDPSGTTPDNFDPDDFSPIDTSDPSPDSYDHIPLGIYWNWVAYALVIGLIVAVIVMTVMKSGMKSVRMKAEASDYVREGSFDLTESNDTYLYRTVTKTEKPKDDDKGSGSSGGGFGSGGNFSSTHTSSSGSTHGGRGGSF